MNNLQKIAPLFSGWSETLIWSVLQGHMGYAMVDNDEAPGAAQVVLGDFCFFAGNPSVAFAAKAAAREIVPQNEAWGNAIEQAWGNRVQRRLRYAIRKEPNVFSRTKLQKYIDTLPREYELRMFDEELCQNSLREDWSRDFCACFADASDFLSRGIGIAVLHNGAFVSGASSYSVYDGGFEIEIDTKPEYRKRGLATACGAKLILTALERNLYPSWDAFDLRSVALAEKLGYHVDHPYIIYMQKD
ncbi:MAG TPA: GNAT family N-acetyltransferase [Clostridia bacterium]|nr:GNAT family N-acetyltransferase [Clostridia bacterium]